MVRPEIAAIVVILTIHRVSASVTPDLELILSSEQVLINEGDYLEINCTDYNKPVFLIYPVSDDSQTTSEYNVSEEVENGRHTKIFQRPNTIYGDTGLYGCPESSLKITSHPHLQVHGSLVYIYVQSDANVFVEKYSFQELRELVGNNVLIPCKPTSPNFTVQLFFNDRPRTNVDFDPRIGFTVQNVTVTDDGYVRCVINNHQVYYILAVDVKALLREPKILEHTLRHVARGQTLRVNCTTEVDIGTTYYLKWNTPQQSSRISERFYSTNGALVQATSELIIEDIRYEDEGWYNCTIHTTYDNKTAKKFIEVHDPQEKFINLTAQDADKHYQRQENDKVQWVVYVHAYPQVVLKWLNPKGNEITGDWDQVDHIKHAVKVTPTETILRINHLNIDDMGEYSLQASNEEKMEMLNFTLDVLVRPIPILKLHSYYPPDEVAEITCDVAAFPTPNVSWNYLKCPQFPSCEDTYPVELNNTSESGMSTRFHSKVSMLIEVSGYLTCTACNIIGCESHTETLLVSDIKDGFGIIEPKQPVIEGDDVEIICAAAVYNYTENFNWRYENGTPIIQDSRVSIEQSRTRFTYRSTLKIKNVTKADEMYYMCSNKEKMDYYLSVDYPVAPHFVFTNMHKNETVIDVNTHETIKLKCLVSGKPKPNVTWYKDGVRLKPNEQYMCKNDAQELNINYLRETDSGRFSCWVENGRGNITAYVTITVKGKGFAKELIVPIVILAFIIVLLLVYFTIKVRRERAMRKQLMEAGLLHFEEGAVECLNPELTVDDQAELLPYDKKWEFPREKLKLGKQLGSGAFGVVMKAEAEGICENEPVTTVAVKMVRRTTVPTYVRALASELKIMVHLGKHLNVVNLLGACTKNISKCELLVIVEYCRYGNLHNYLLRHRASFINQIDPATDKLDSGIGLDLLNRHVSVSSNNRIKYVALSFSRSLSENSATEQNSAVDSQGVSMYPDGYLSNNSSQPEWRSNYRGDYKDYNLKPICTQDLLSWAFQVARGMEYLSQRKVLHGDLAARNILLAEDNVVKICDFGLARTMYKDNNYKKKSDGLLPIKWMAIESIRDRIFSTQSDIWSFGVVLWEFFTLAETPYPGMEADKQYQKLIEGYRMEKPEYATSEVYDIMLQCWKAKPSLRPSFTELVESIGDLLEENVRAHYIDLNSPYTDMNTSILKDGRSDYLQMLSAPDHAALSSPTYTNLPSSTIPDSAYLCMSPGSQRDESGIFSPGHVGTHFEFPAPTSDTEDAVEMSPMLKKQDDDPYLKPINVHERRAEFVRQMRAKKDQEEQRPVSDDSGYTNTPRNLRLIDLNAAKAEDDGSGNGPAKKDFAIIRTQDNYVNMPMQKSDLKQDLPDGFSNPSYVMMTNGETDRAVACD